MERLAGVIARLPTHRETQRRVQELIAEERCQDRRYVWRRKQRDPMFAVVMALRGRVRVAILSRGPARKADGIWGLVGCSRDTLRAHLERQFTPGMSWANYGQWEIEVVASFEKHNEA
jgi:hypothetical protein